jgi:tetratricopeptide (TPR) repeat protein
MNLSQRTLVFGVAMSVFTLVTSATATAQKVESPADASGHFHIALPDQNGAFEWSAPGYNIAQMTVKSRGEELGVRGVNPAAKLMFIAFIFKVQEPVDSPRVCRAGDMTENIQDPDIKVVGKTEIANSWGSSVPLVEYARANASGVVQPAVAAFVGAGSTCASIEFTGENGVHLNDPALTAIIQTMRYAPDYAPQFRDVFLYGQIFYEKKDYKEAAPYFEQSIHLLGNGAEAQTWRRVATDQAGIAYGISGDVKASRAVFEAAIAKDPDYPMYYYNLACADAAEKNLPAAKEHLQQAFERKANVIPGEALPDPKTDDSFTPYKSDRQFWSFVSALK